MLWSGILLRSTAAPVGDGGADGGLAVTPNSFIRVLWQTGIQNLGKEVKMQSPGGPAFVLHQPLKATICGSLGRCLWDPAVGLSCEVMPDQWV